jgi:hypothetical protein
MSEDASNTTLVESRESESAYDRPGFPSIVLWLVMALFLAYPLSLGPVVKFYRSRQVPGTVFILYAPLEYVDRHCRPVHRAIDWYLHLWGAD